MNYCDEQFFDLIKVLMIADNQSYLFLGYTAQYQEDERTKYLETIKTLAEEWKVGIKSLVAEKLNQALVSQNALPATTL